MKRNGKIGVLAALLCVCLALTFVPTVNAAYNTPETGFTANHVEIKGENEALNGWQYYFYNSTLTWYYHSNELFVRATENGRTGNAMEIERKKATDELWVYSYSFDVEPNTNYNISAYVKIPDASGKLVWCVSELDENGDSVSDSTTGGATQYIDRHSVSGVLTDWTETSFTRTTEATTKKMLLRIRVEGTGIIDIDDVTVEKTVAPNVISYKMMAIGNDGSSENPATYSEVTESNLSDDSSDGDGKSLLLKDHDVFMPSFGMLPHGVNYRLSFKYKRLSNASNDKLSIYLDNMNPSIVRAHYADGISGGSTTEWTSYSYDFNAKSGDTDITFMRIASYGSYLIDELEINTLNEYVLNGSFENTEYYGRFAFEEAPLGASTGVTVDNTVLENGNRTLKIEGGKIAYVRYSMILPKSTKYNLSFRYKKISDSEKSPHSSANKGILITTDGFKTDSSQFYDLGWQNSSNNGEWVNFSYDFLSLGAGTSDIQYVRLWACYGDYLIDDISIKCVDNTFADIQYIINGNFGGAYLDGYKFFGTTNFGFAKQSDGNFAFGSMHYTWHVGVGNRGYFRINTDMLENGKEYALSFDYYANGSGVEVLGVYNGNASDSKKEFVSINSPVTKWTHHEATFTAGQFSQDFLEVYGSAYGQNSTFIKNIQITDKTTGETYITNQSLIAPNGLIYSSDFGTGNTEYTWSDWTIENGEIRGFTYENKNSDYKVCLNGTADTIATAITKAIDVTGKNTVKVDKQIYYTADSSFGKNLTVTLLVGDSELTANESGYFVLPEGTTSVKVKFSTNEFVTFKYVDVQTHEHGDTCASVSGEQYNVYAFNADNTACTATRYYPCGKLIKTETVNTVISGDNATFTEKGTATCTATFADGDFETQTKVIETPMKSAPDVKMLKNGASIRANAPYGIRWAAGVRAADWNKLVELYGAENVKAGVIVAPLDYVNKASEFTFAALDEKSLSYSDIVTDMFNEEANAVLSGYNGFYASLVNIKDGNLNRKFAARAYVSVVVNGETTYYYGEYSADNQARSIYEISKSVILSDTESDAVKAFATAVLNKIVCVTVDGENISIPAIEGYISPYTASISGGVITITATDGANINDLKVICLNGKNYKPTISGNTATLVTIG